MSALILTIFMSLSFLLNPSLQSGLAIFTRMLPVIATEKQPTAPAVKPCGSVPAEMSCIPGGWFLRGDNKGRKNEKPEAKVFVNSFLMDKYEATSGEYKKCMAAGKCPKEGPNYKGFSSPKQPVVGVSWYAAKAFCEWKGKRLPTEAEWEKAARGPGGTKYSWGNEKPTCKRACIHDNKGKGCGTGVTKPVGSYPVGAYGLYDMNGNSWEWVSDWYSKSYAACGASCLGIDPKGPCDGAKKCPGYKLKIVKGGSWWWNWQYASSSYRRLHVPSNRNPYHHFGFRCAKDVQ